ESARRHVATIAGSSARFAAEVYCTDATEADRQDAVAASGDAAASVHALLEVDWTADGDVVASSEWGGPNAVVPGETLFGPVAMSAASLTVEKTVATLATGDGATGTVDIGTWIVNPLSDPSWDGAELSGSCHQA
ncbi:MAG: hypothetical protein GY882_00165, partial [Actinomycetia bacterium]|nr:hypothetical protein [Actinomycetes bacterium]